MNRGNGARDRALAAVLAVAQGGAVAVLAWRRATSEEQAASGRGLLSQLAGLAPIVALLSRRGSREDKGSDRYARRQMMRGVAHIAQGVIELALALRARKAGEG